MWLNPPFQGQIRDSRRVRDQGRAAHRALAHRRSSMPRIEVLENRALLSVLTVRTNDDSGPGSLRATIAAAPSGAIIRFAKGVHNITLTSGQLQITQSLDIEGPGANKLTISGNDTSRVFDIEGTMAVIIAGLTITHGRSDVTAANHQGIGGAIYHNGNGTAFTAGGTLTLSRVVVSNSQAMGSFNSPADPTHPGHIGGAFAGGIFNQDGTLNISHSTLINNRSIGANGGTSAVNTPAGDAEGGCINNSSIFGSAYLSINDSSVIGNIAQAGNGSAGSIDATPGFFGIVNLAVGGGIMNFNYTFLPSPQPVVTSVASITNTKLIGNQAIGGSGGKGGNASRDIVGVGFGGAVANDFNCSTIINNSTLIGNQAIGGSRGTGGTGAVQQIDVGEGAGIGNLGTVFVNRDTFINNTAQGGSGGTPGTGATQQQVDIGEGGGLASILGIGNGTVTKSSFVHNLARGGISANGFGGGLFNDKGDTATIIASLFTLNQAIAGEGGQGIGGGIYSLGTIINRVGILTNKHKPNHATTSNNDIFPSPGDSNILS